MRVGINYNSVAMVMIDITDMLRRCDYNRMFDKLDTGDDTA
jgi:hypothetical protein